MQPAALVMKIINFIGKINLMALRGKLREYSSLKLPDEAKKTQIE